MQTLRALTSQTHFKGIYFYWPSWFTITLHQCGAFYSPLALSQKTLKEIIPFMEGNESIAVKYWTRSPQIFFFFSIVIISSRSHRRPAQHKHTRRNPKDLRLSDRSLFCRENIPFMRDRPVRQGTYLLFTGSLIPEASCSSTVKLKSCARWFKPQSGVHFLDSSLLLRPQSLAEEMDEK